MTEITSLSLPSFPFLSFISRKAIRHIPPKTILTHIGQYSLQENLVHEALHHEMTACVLMGQSFTTPDALNREISIPWRGVSWRLDRCLHASFIYANVIDMRQRFLDHVKSGDLSLEKRNTNEIQDSLNQATEALDYLRTTISDMREFVSPKVQEAILA